MIPIDQQKFKDGLGVDCWAACIASLLEVPYEEVPDLHRVEMVDQMVATQSFLQTREMVMKTGWAEHLARIPSEFFIGTGISPRSPEDREVWHAVICTLDEDRIVRIAHDPHPSRDGLRGDAKYFYWIVPHEHKWPDRPVPEKPSPPGGGECSEDTYNLHMGRMFGPD